MFLKELSRALRNNRASSSGKGATMEYIAYLHKDKNSDYGVSFPDFPGCITAGSSLEEARRMAAEALSFHIAGLQEDGDPIPSPSTLDELRNDPAMKGAVAFPVDAKEPEKTVRINITARESMVRRALQTQAAVIELGGLKGKRVSVDSTPRAFRKSRQN
jgi:predicted RNase H-like HicB family nuclease